MQTFRNLLREKGLSQAELAKKVGVTERAIDHWCAGRNGPNLRVGYRVAYALGITLEELAIIFLNGEAADSRGSEAARGS